ncbi:hypothetical protein BV898_18665 [Hypsibius exemplaris]|uniref:Uncharacterized protein n=1 Tax=Hypsibius exemplaris TaxID=2072580 RepID=A0A9X6NJA3_HYPEX|nr:hypothetical protein BV898_18665 [Hypsibius exemplaris]
MSEYSSYDLGLILGLGIPGLLLLLALVVWLRWYAGEHGGTARRCGWTSYANNTPGYGRRTFTVDSVSGNGHERLTESWSTMVTLPGVGRPAVSEACVIDELKVSTLRLPPKINGGRLSVSRLYVPSVSGSATPIPPDD